MDLVSLLLSAGLFYAFVPGVFFRMPEGASRGKVLAVHALLFALSASLVMWFYWTQIRQMLEPFGNYGATCPNGYMPGVNQGGQQDCVPVGHATYDPAKPAPQTGK